MDIEKLRARLTQHGQEHVLRFWAELSDTERRSLYDELDGLDLARLNEAFKECMGQEAGAKGESADGSIDDRLEPPPEDVVGSVVQTDQDTLASYERQGLYF